MSDDEKLVHFLSDDDQMVAALCGAVYDGKFSATNYDADAVTCGDCRRALAKQKGAASALLRVGRLAPLPRDLPREAARAAGLLLLLVARGSAATEEECERADGALEGLRRRFPEVAQALSEWHAEVA